MIVKFHARGSGGGAAPVDYLLGKERDREGATLDRGDPDEITQLIDSSKYAQKYTSGVLSFEEGNLSRADKDRIMSSFEKTLLPGLDGDQYAVLWVEHLDKERLELNFVVPNVELTTGKRLQPYYDPADRTRINAWKNIVNHEYGLSDPDDPLKKRELMTPRDLPESKQEAARAITDGLLAKAGSGELKDRQDVLNALTGAGFTIARQTKQSISIADPDGGRNIRLKGMIYEQDFRFGKELRGEIEAAGERYRADSERRIQAARRTLEGATERKCEQNRQRHTRPAITADQVRDNTHELLDRGTGHRSVGADTRADVSGLHDQKKAGHSRSDAGHDQRAGEQGRGLGAEQLRGSSEAMRSDKQKPDVPNQRRGNVRHANGVLSNDRDRAGVIKRAGSYAGEQREAASELDERSKRLRADVQGYAAGERAAQAAGRGLAGASQQLDQINQAVKALKAQKSKARSQSRGMER